VKHQIVIKRHRPWLKPTLLGGGAAILALLAWGLYSYTRAHTVTAYAQTQSEVEKLRSERRQLSQQLRDAQGQIAKLKDSVVYAQRSGEIDAQACDLVQATLPKLQKEVADLHEQLAFYRGIVSPDQARAGVRVYNLKLTRAAVQGSYNYELVLIQSARHDQRVAGRIEVTLEGMQGSSRRTVRLSDIADDAGKNLLFSFTYFEEIDGRLSLPEGFKPQRVNVKLSTDVDGAPAVEDQFDWAKIVAS
jgi:hypothetical protein